MSRCYHCGEILADDWIRKQGASLLGKKGGLVKARSQEQAKEASRVRWAKTRATKAAAARKKKAKT